MSSEENHDQREAESAPSSSGCSTSEDQYAVIGEDGWQSTDTPPRHNRLVQFAYDDMSYSERTVGSYDTRSGEEDKPPVWWMDYPALNPCPTDAIGAWRELPKD